VPLVSLDGTRLGAFEVLNRRDGAFTAEDEDGLAELASHAAVALENTQQFAELLERHEKLVEQAAQDTLLVGESPAIQSIRKTLRRIADTDLAVLILGENGTGKEVVARSIHFGSRRRKHPFIAVNCAALTETLLESELFGHEKGAFTDAHEARAGKFELASGGTLFLDEIGDMSLAGQAKLLRVLEDKTIVRVGGSKPIHTDVRVLAATNQKLADLVRAKRFREDLYFRLNVVSLELPPLRDRGADIMLLAEHFLREFSRKAGRRLLKFSAAARKRLESHTWPGNVRELRNLTERLAYLSAGDRIEAEDLAFILAPSANQQSFVDSGLNLNEATSEFQRKYIQQAIDRARGNVSQAARNLDVHRSNLYRKMRQLGMETGDEADDDAD
jgi:Nif-specific regulatory protein